MAPGQGIIRESVVLLQHTYGMRLGMLHAIAPRTYYPAHAVKFDDNSRYFTANIILSMIDISLKERYFPRPVSYLTEVTNIKRWRKKNTEAEAEIEHAEYC